MVRTGRGLFRSRTAAKSDAARASAKPASGLRARGKGVRNSQPRRRVPTAVAVPPLEPDFSATNGDVLERLLSRFAVGGAERVPCSGRESLRVAGRACCESV